MSFHATLSDTALFSSREGADAHVLKCLASSAGILASLGEDPHDGTLADREFIKTLGAVGLMSPAAYSSFGIGNPVKASDGLIIYPVSVHFRPAAYKMPKGSNTSWYHWYDLLATTPTREDVWVWARETSIPKKQTTQPNAT